LFGEKAIQCRSGDTEDFGSPALVAPGFFQGFDNGVRFEFWFAIPGNIKPGLVDLEVRGKVFGFDLMSVAFR